MNVYIWYVDKATDNYHSDGGVVVFAATEERARELANSTEGCNIAAEEAPLHVRACADGEERVHIFPNAGCC